jgi:hypothetical protein
VRIPVVAVPVPVGLAPAEVQRVQPVGALPVVVRAGPPAAVVLVVDQVLRGKVALVLRLKVVVHALRVVARPVDQAGMRRRKTASLRLVLAGMRKKRT